VPEQQTVIRSAMQSVVRGVDLSRRKVVLPEAPAGVIATLRADLAGNLGMAVTR
jgi:hypothetical protein